MAVQGAQVNVSQGIFSIFGVLTQGLDGHFEPAVGSGHRLHPLREENPLLRGPFRDGRVQQVERFKIDGFCHAERYEDVEQFDRCQTLGDQKFCGEWTGVFKIIDATKHLRTCLNPQG